MYIFGAQTYYCFSKVANVQRISEWSSRCSYGSILCSNCLSFNPFVYYYITLYILNHTRPITTSIYYAAVDYGLDLTHIHSLTTNVKLLFLHSCIISNPTINDFILRSDE